MRRTLFLLVLAACSRSPSEPSSSPQESRPSTSSSNAGPAAAPSPAPTREPHPPVATPVAPLALKWDDPAGWKRRPPSSAMRAAEYFVPRTGDDKEDGECSVITFGPDKGGSVDDNVERWAKQLGAAPAAVERTSRTVHGMKVTRVEIAGTYTPMALPSIPPGPPRPGYRLVGDIVEAPSGLWFFKLTAPDGTAKAAGKALDRLIDSLRPA